MTDLPDWALDKAREWLDGDGGDACVSLDQSDAVLLLAALLVEVGNQRAAEAVVSCCVCENVKAPRPDCDCVICYRNRVLADVRRVVEEECDKAATEMGPARYAAATAIRKALLSRLDAIRAQREDKS